MYCSPKQFIDIAKTTGVDEQDLSEMLEIIVHLVQRRGSLVKSVKLQELIQKEAPIIAKMITLLGSIDKLDIASLKALLSEVRTGDNHHFTVRAQKTTGAIQKKLEEQFGNVEVEILSTDVNELQVTGDGRRYKRSLDKDLDKILS